MFAISRSEAARGGRADLMRCFGCGGLFPDIEGTTHRYIASSTGFWAAYGEVLARQYTDANYEGAGQLTIDAYAVQHPGRPSAQSIQSVALHLISLCLLLERGVELGTATEGISAAAKDKRRFAWLAPPETMGPITVANVHAARTAAEHVAIVRSWASSAWSAWAAHHVTVRDGWRSSGVACV